VKPLHTPRAYWLLALAFLLPNISFGFGFDHGNPGDTVTREFRLTALDIFQRLKLLPASEINGIDMNRLAGAIANVEVQSQENVFLRGVERDAINDPDKNLIVVSRSRWAPLQFADRTESRLGLVLHEYLFFVGIDDTGFDFSRNLIAKLNVKNFNTGRFWNPLNPVNRITTNLVFNPGNCKLDGLNFNTAETEEEKEVATTGDCGDAYRRVLVLKTHLQAPPSSQWQGIFHRFEIHVFDGAGVEMQNMTYEPDWGQCLLPTDGTCSVSGKLFVGGVELRFWFQR
jgi:hypothetical protein